MTRVPVNGAGGFIGGHLVKRRKAERFWGGAGYIFTAEHGPDVVHHSAAISLLALWREGRVAGTIADIAGQRLHVVRGRNSDNRLARERPQWEVRAASQVRAA